MVSRRVQSKQPKFDEKAAKAFLRALSAAIVALEDAKAASPTYMPPIVASKLSRAAVETNMVAFAARLRIDEMSRQLALPLDPPKKKSKQLRMPT
jgi:hypothetical protein